MTVKTCLDDTLTSQNAGDSKTEMALKSHMTYELEPGPPAISWEVYSQNVARDWDGLLNSTQSKIEKNIQRFLETHPCMVPGGQSMGGPSGHSAFPAAVISQPRLPGFVERVPDFVWIATDSLNVYAVLIEIESPSKRIFTKRGRPSAQFTEAQNQLAEWKVWLSNSNNLRVFREAYCPIELFPFKKFVPQYVLIYGRRIEWTENPEFNLMRSEMQRENEFYMTFDRLHPIRDQLQYMTVKYSKQRYEAISIPATIELGPLLADYRSRIMGKEDIASKIPYLTEERKAFLARRFSYWDKWVKSGGNGFRNLGDRE